MVQLEGSKIGLPLREEDILKPLNNIMSYPQIPRCVNRKGHGLHTKENYLPDDVAAVSKAPTIDFSQMLMLIKRGSSMRNFIFLMAFSVHLCLPHKFQYLNHPSM